MTALTAHYEIHLFEKQGRVLAVSPYKKITFPDNLTDLMGKDVPDDVRIFDKADDAHDYMMLIHIDTVRGNMLFFAHSRQEQEK